MDVGKGFLNFTRIVCNLLSIIVRQIMHQTLSISISNAFIKDTYLRSLYISPWISLFCNLSKFFFYLKVLFPFCGVKKKNVINVFMLFLLEINITKLRDDKMEFDRNDIFCLLRGGQWCYYLMEYTSYD